MIPKTLEKSNDVGTWADPTQLCRKFKVIQLEQVREGYLSGE